MLPTRCVVSIKYKSVILIQEEQKTYAYMPYMINNHLCCISYQNDNNKTRAIDRYNIKYTKWIKFRYFNPKELDVRSLK